MNWTDFLAAGGTVTTLLLLAVFLSSKGLLLWRTQVDREIKAIVDAAAKLDEVRVEQIEEERADKLAWKSAYMNLVTGMKTAVEGVVEVAKKVGP